GPCGGPRGVAQQPAPDLPREFILDPTTGKLVFGEGGRGKRPPHGNGSAPRHGGGKGGNVAAAPYGSASILTITWMYIRMMGADGLKRASEIAILNANYIAKRLDPYFPVLFQRKHGLVAHGYIRH